MRVAMESRKQAASRPRPPLPKAASRSCNKEFQGGWIRRFNCEFAPGQADVCCISILAGGYDPKYDIRVSV